MGCGDQCPHIPDTRYIDWDLKTPPTKDPPTSASPATTSHVASKNYSKNSPPLPSSHDRRARALLRQLAPAHGDKYQATRFAHLLAQPPPVLAGVRAPARGWANMALWMVFSSERVPYRRVFDASDDVETVDVPLTIEHCNALGVRAGADAARRRTLNDAGRRVCEADRSFIEFQAHGGRGRPSFLRVVRRSQGSSFDRPFAPPDGDQLTLVHAS